MFVVPLREWLDLRVEQGLVTNVKWLLKRWRPGQRAAGNRFVEIDGGSEAWVGKPVHISQACSACLAAGLCLTLCAALEPSIGLMQISTPLELPVLDDRSHVGEDGGRGRMVVG